jgi:hypothetical protein
MPDQERPWVRLTGALILGAGAVAAALIPLYCAKTSRLAETTTTVLTSQAEIDALKKRIIQDDQTIGAQVTEIAQLHKRTPVAPDCPPVPAPVSTPATTTVERSPPEAAPAALARHAINSVLEHEVTFDLQSCNLSGSTLTCNLLFTSKGADRSLYLEIDQHSRLFDLAGNEVRARQIAAGANHGCQGCDIETSLPSDIPMAGHITFEGVQRDTKRLRLMEIQCKIKDPDGSWHVTLVKFASFDL